MVCISTETSACWWKEWTPKIIGIYLLSRCLHGVYIYRNISLLMERDFLISTVLTFDIIPGVKKSCFLELVCITWNHYRVNIFSGCLNLVNLQDRIHVWGRGELVWITWNHYRVNIFSGCLNLMNNLQDRIHVWGTGCILNSQVDHQK